MSKARVIQNKNDANEKSLMCPTISERSGYRIPSIHLTGTHGTLAKCQSLYWEGHHWGGKKDTVSNDKELID